MDGQTFSMLQLVEMVQNMVTEFLEFGSTQDQQNFISVQLSMETKTIVTIVLHFIATRSVKSPFNKFKTETVEIITTTKLSSMEEKLLTF